MNTKVCKHCGKNKSVLEFEARKDSKDGRRAQCNDCRKNKISNRKKKIVSEEPVIYFEHDPYYQF